MNQKSLLNITEELVFKAELSNSKTAGENLRFWLSRLKAHKYSEEDLIFIKRGVRNAVLNSKNFLKLCDGIRIQKFLKGTEA